MQRLQILIASLHLKKIILRFFSAPDSFPKTTVLSQLPAACSKDKCQDYPNSDGSCHLYENESEFEYAYATFTT